MSKAKKNTPEPKKAAPVKKLEPVIPAKETPAPPENAEPAPKKLALIETLKPYLTAYPNNKIFFISSDGHVFLESNEVAANDHQKSIDTDASLVKYEA